MFDDQTQTRVRLVYHGLAGGGFPVSNRVLGFSIHAKNGTHLNLIYKAEIDPEYDRVDVLLHLVSPPPPDAALYYGYGYDPICNLTDKDDLAAPAFGPVTISNGEMS